MKILHINSEYRDSKVHKELMQRLDRHGITQTIYCFFRGEKYVGVNQFEGRCTSFVYADILSPFDKYLFHYKSWKIYRHLKSKVDIRTFNLTNAATLFSNGYISYKIFKKYGIPYVVSVRSTDLMYYRIAPFMAQTGLKILMNASRIVFISASLEERLKNVYTIKKHLGVLEQKFQLQPNGINKYWIDNVNTNHPVNKHKIIYVGNFVSRKNIPLLIDAISKLRQESEYDDTTLTIVGGQKDTNGETRKVVESNDFVSFWGIVKDKEKLRDIYRNHSIFAMPSFFETFGLVYIEALTQNLAVIYSRGFGIDGMLPKNAGERVNPYDVEDVCKSIKKIFDDRSAYTNEEMDFSQYDWDVIVNNYLELYNNIINNRKQ